MRAAIPAVPVRFDTFPLTGGLDQHTPQLSLKPGFVREAVNFECSVNGGYTRIPGYERYDGRPSPSAANYVVLELSAVAGLAVGDAVSGATSGATAVVAAIDGLNVVVTKTTGTFQAGENLMEGAAVIGTIADTAPAIASQVTQAEYALAAANMYRQDITAVPGSGAIRGLVVFDGALYAVRDNAGATAAVLHKATAGGWTEVALHHEVEFTAGSGTEPAEGASITQGAVSAVVRRVVIQSGSFSGGDAAGRFIIDAPTGGSFSAGALTAGATATLSGANSQITLLPGGRFEFQIGNVGRGTRLYGCDGVNRGFEFDGTALVPIRTGMSADSPTHLFLHKNHLFFSFGPSAQHSSIGNPYQWSVVTGAAELLARGAITNFLALPGDATAAALAIISDSAVDVLYGSSSADWKLVGTTDRAGSKAYTAQTLGRVLMFDDNGVTSLQAVAAFGNFSGATLTERMRSFVQQRRTLVTASLTNQEKSQYRLFFSDGYALYLTIVNGRLVGGMPMLFPNAVAAACSGDSVSGAEVSYFGSTNGFVYRLDIGTSFDGEAIDASFALAFAHQGGPLVRKRYRKAMFELQGEGYAEFSAGYDLAWGSEDVDQGSVPVAASPVYWDELTWDEFQWDGRAIAPSELRIEGVAENLAVRVEQSSALWPSYTINSVTLAYTPRRIQR